MNTKFNRLGSAFLLAMAPGVVCPAQATDLLVQRPQLSMGTALHIAQGAVGVSGSATGEQDAACAQAGVDAVQADLDLQGQP